MSSVSGRRPLVPVGAARARWRLGAGPAAARDAGEVVTRHLLDSLTILPLVRGQHMLDIGSGAGFPALPLAICYDDVSMVSMANVTMLTMLSMLMACWNTRLKKYFNS